MKEMQPLPLYIHIQTLKMRKRKKNNWNVEILSILKKLELNALNGELCSVSTHPHQMEVRSFQQFSSQYSNPHEVIFQLAVVSL